MTPVAPIQFGRALTATVLSVLLAAPANLGAAQAAEKPKFTAEAYESLKSLIKTTPLESMDLDFFKQVYGRPQAPGMLKLIFGAPELEPQSKRLAALRQFYDWTVQAEWARDNHAIIENTNAGKDNGARSDLDATANVLEFDPASGDWVIREKTVASLIEHQKKRYSADHLTPEGVDVTLFNGDVWLPDWRDARMSYQEFSRKLVRGSWDAAQRKGAYSVPGANKEQTHDRPLREGRTVHIGWDYAANRPSINGLPVEFDAKLGKIVTLVFDRKTGLYKPIGPVGELSTREAAGRGKAVRYQGVADLPPEEAWRRSFGNSVQNLGEFFEAHDPVARNKYFIERAIDQGAGRFTHLEASPQDSFVHNDPNVQPAYVQIQGAEGMGEAEKLAWKRSFIGQAFGLPEGDRRIAEIQSVLDRSAEIQLDKVKGRAAYADRVRQYYAEEWTQAVENIREQQARAAAQDKPVSPAEISRLQEAEAERLFVEKQRRILIEATIQVARETFKRDFPEETHARRDRFSEPGVAKKIAFERGVELARLMDLIESAPQISPVLRDKLRAGLLEAIPEGSRSLVTSLAELCRLKLGLIGGFKDERFRSKPPSQLWAEVNEELKTKFGASDAAPPLADDEVRKAIHELIRKNLGPVDAPKFEQAWQAGKTALVARFGARAYVKDIVEQADSLMLTGAALGLVNAYQQNCIGQTSWNEACLQGLASETGNQVMFLLPGINTGWMIVSGLKSIGEGRLQDGSTSLALGVFSLPSISGMLGVPGALFVRMYVGLQIVSLGVAVTYGYALQTMENDAVEQAFKALKEPGKQARPYVYPGRSSLFAGDTPTLPLLSDVITGKGKDGEELVPADGWDDRERNRVAAAQHAKSIEAELRELGLEAGSPEWEEKKRETIVRYAALLPYLQRTANMYRVFGPRVEARLKAGQVESSMETCLEVRQGDVEKKYQGPPSFWDRVRFWRDTEKAKQGDLAAAWSECVEKAGKEDEEILAPVFNAYLEGWLRKQEGSARTQYASREMRARLRNALVHEYVVHRHLDQGSESRRQMERSLAQAKEAAAARVQLVGKVLQTQKGFEQSIDAKLKQAAEAGSHTVRPEIKPQLALRAPSFAVRIGEDAHIDFAVRGQYYRDEQRNDWKASLDGEVVKVALGPPDNLIMTKELEAELKPEAGKPRKRLVTVEEKLKGEARDGAGNLLASAETVARYFDVVEWEGRIEVETRAAAADPAETYAYPGAVVRVTGPSQIEKQAQPMGSSGNLAGAVFEDLPEGKFTIRVEPPPDDKHHRAAEAVTTLTGVSSEAGAGGQPLLVLGKDRDSLVVVLPYVASKDTAETAAQPPEKPKLPEPSPEGPPAAAPAAADAGRVAQCDALVVKTRAALLQRDLAAASNLLREAQTSKCAGIAAVANDVAAAQAERSAEIRQIENGIGEQMGACDFEKAMALARQLADLDPANAWVTANLARLQQLAAEQARVGGLLSAADGSLPASQVPATLALLRQSLETAPACMAAEIRAAIQQLERRAADADVQGFSGQIRALFEACEYVKALAIAQQLQAAAPSDPWLEGNLGRLQATAAAQARVQALLGAAREFPADKDASALLAQLRQSLETAPTCMADQIRGAIAALDRPAAQKPVWLQDSPSKPASDHTPDDSIERARETYQRTASEEGNRQKQRDEERRLAERRRQEEERIARQDEQRRAAEEAAQQQRAADEQAQQRRERAQRRAAAIGGLLQTLPAIIANRGGIPIPSKPSVGGGTAPAQDPLVGAWVGFGRVTANRQGNKDSSTVDARGDPQENGLAFRISKSGTRYVFDAGGRQAVVRYASGNRIGITVRLAMDGGHSATVTGDYQVTGNRMTGTQRAEGEDGSMITMSVTLTRQ